jgi:hypothetical protein
VLARFALLLGLVGAFGACAFACSGFRTERIEPPDAEVADAGDLGKEAEAGSASPMRIVHDVQGGGALRGIWGSAPNDVYVVGDQGVVLHYTGDPEPSEAKMGSGVDLASVWGAGPREVYAVGTVRNTNKGMIFRRTTDIWTEFGTAPHGLRAVWGIDDTRYASGNDGALYSGPSSAPFSTGIQIDKAPNTPDTLFAPILYSIGGNNALSIMLAGDIDTTYYFDGTWHTYLDPIDRTRAFRAIFAPLGNDVLVYEGANYYGLWRFTGSQNGVIQLNEEKDVPQNVERSIWSIWGPNGQKIVAVGDGGRIMTYDAATQKVTVIPSPTGRNLYAVWGTSFDDLWIAGEGQLVMRGALRF